MDEQDKQLLRAIAGQLCREVADRLDQRAAEAAPN